MLPDGTLLSLTRLDSCVATVVQNLVLQEMKGSYKQKQYCDLFETVVQVVTSELFRTVHHII